MTQNEELAKMLEYSENVEINKLRKERSRCFKRSFIKEISYKRIKKNKILLKQFLHNLSTPKKNNK